MARPQTGFYAGFGAVLFIFYSFKGTETVFLKLRKHRKIIEKSIKKSLYAFCGRMRARMTGSRFESRSTAFSGNAPVTSRTV